MTGGEALLNLPRELKAALPRLPKPLADIMDYVTPRQGWTTFLLLIGSLLTVSVTIAQAEWTLTPGIIQLSVYSTLAGMWLAKVRWKWTPWPLLLLAGLVIGLLSVWWQTSTLVIGEPLFEQFRITGVRLYDWYFAATNDGISTDLLPFSMALLGGMWILGFFSAFALFRRNNFWVLVVLGGTSLFTHVSFLPEELSLSFFVFMFFAVLLIARMTFLQREKEWKAGEVSVGPLSGLLSLNWGVALAASVLIIAALLPMEPWVSRFVARTWNNARAPVVTLQDGFSRLVTGVDSKRNLPGRLFGNNLPFLGSIRFNGEVVFWADTEYASYWLSRTYSEYTAKGWIAGDTIELKVGPDTVFPTPGDSRKRTPVPQRLQVMFNTQGLLAGGDLEWLSRNAVLETLAPMEFVVTLADASADAEFPADIQTVAQDIRAELNGTPNPFIESAVASVLPNDLVVTSIGYKGAAADREPVEVTLRRKDPVTPEIVSFRFDDDLLKEEVYAMVSLVSTATDEDLRHAGTGYSNTIKDHYLQLPSTLPQRVRDLALQITAGAATPLDKARAIEAYLRGPGFTYSQTIDKPPDGADGVDYFLFETRTGYSDYFASSMTVLLRAVGVPARMAAGFAPGEINAQTGLLAVRDTDSHGWVQVYFPAYGWIDFEPTPAWPEHERVMGLPSSGVPGGLLDGGTIESQQRGELNRFLFPAEIANIGLGSPGLGDQSTSPWTLGRVLIILGSLVGSILVLFGLIQLAWRLMSAGLTPVEQAYAGMTRLAALAGIGRLSSQTSQQFARALAASEPSIATEVGLIAWRFAISRYSHRDPSEEEYIHLKRSWKTVRGVLLRRALRRLNPIPNGRNGKAPARANT